MDVDTALAILNPKAATPPPAGTAPVGGVDRRLSILKGANPDSVPGSVRPDGAPGSAFTEDPNAPGAELRHLNADEVAASRVWGTPIMPGDDTGPGPGLHITIRPKQWLPAGTPMRQDDSAPPPGPIAPPGAAMPPPSPPAPPGPSTFQNITSGGNRGAAGLVGMPVDLTSDVLNLGLKWLNQHGTNIAPITDPAGGSATWLNVMKKLGMVQDPVTEGDTLTQAAAGGAVNMLGWLTGTGEMNKLAGTVREAMPAGQKVREVGGAAVGGAAQGVGGELGHQLAQKLMPNMPWADWLLSNVGAMTVGTVPGLFTGAVKAPFKANTAVRKPFDPNEQQRFAGKILNENAANGVPTEADVARPPVIPGAPQTLGRVTTDPGILNFENQLNKGNSQTIGQNTNLTAEGNKAIVTALNEIPGAGARSSVVEPAVRAEMERQAAERAAALKAQLDNVDRALSQAGSGRGPSANDASRAARAEADRAFQGVNDTEDQLWRAIDPAGKEKPDVAPLRTELDEYLGGLTDARRGFVPPEVLALLERAGLRGPQRGAATGAPRYPVAGGTFASGESSGMPRVPRAGGDRRGQPGAPMSQFNTPTELHDIRSLIGGIRRKLYNQGEFNGANVVAGLEKAFARGLDRIQYQDPELNIRYQEARQFSADKARRFGQGAMYDIRSTTAQGAAKVKPSKTLKTVTATPEDVSQYLDATDRSPAAQAAVRNYLLRDFERTAMPKGILDPEKARAWMNEHGDKLDAIDPATRGWLQDAANSQEGANGIRDWNDQTQLADERSAAAKFLGTDPIDAIGSIMSGKLGKDPLRAADQLMQQVAHSPAATQGVRRALVDWLFEQSTGRKVNVAGDAVVDSGRLDELARENAAAINRVLSPQQLTVLRAVQQAARENVAAERATGPGSQTFQLLSGDRFLDVLLGNAGGRAMRHATKLGVGLGGSVGLGVGTALGGPLGAAVGGAAGGTVGGMLGDWLTHVYSAPRDEIMALVRKGIADPEFGRMLMLKANEQNAKLAGPRLWLRTAAAPSAATMAAKIPPNANPTTPPQ